VVSEALLKRGAKIDQKQAGGSTPLHGAAYYGQSLIVKLLLAHGADPSLKNVFGNTAADEASSSETKQAFEDHVEDPVSKIISTLVKTGFAEDGSLQC
jgi:ankyrin repeat protein